MIGARHSAAGGQYHTLSSSFLRSFSPLDLVSAIQTFGGNYLEISAASFFYKWCEGNCKTMNTNHFLRTRHIKPSSTGTYHTLAGNWKTGNKYKNCTGTRHLRIRQYLVDAKLRHAWVTYAMPCKNRESRKTVI